MTVNLAVGILEVTLGSCVCLYTHMHCFEYAHSRKQKCKTRENRKSFTNFHLLKACTTNIASALAWAGYPCPVQASCTQTWLIILICYWHQKNWDSEILVELHMLQSHTL